VHLEESVKSHGNLLRAGSEANFDHLQVLSGNRPFRYPSQKPYPKFHLCIQRMFKTTFGQPNFPARAVQFQQ
jgi:hypothetical protein